MKMKKKVKLIVDLQYGSTGKGLIAGYLSETFEPDVVVTANMPNAGHTYINSKGRKWVHKVLPNAIVSRKLEYVLIGPAAVFSLDRLMEEIESSKDILSGVSILIHPNATPLKKIHKASEDEMGMHQRIGSTAQGSGTAMIDKIMRNPDDKVIAKDVLVGGDWDLLDFSSDTLMNNITVRVTTHDEYRQVLNNAKSVIAEGAQGYSLGVNQHFYPYCTSRECTPARFLSDMMIPISMLEEVIGVARTYPIRVAGTSGDCYPDQREMTWEELDQVPELTTVTQKVRRVFTWSDKQIQDAIWECQPNRVFLNFANYLEDFDQLESISQSILEAGSQVDWIGVGPTFSDVISSWKLDNLTPPEIEELMKGGTLIEN